jgi:hypothetical protein
MHKLIYCLFFLCAIVGCEAAQREIEAKKLEDAQKLEDFNRNELSKEGTEIGALPDGRKVVRYCVYSRCCGGCFDGEHYIYVISGSNTVNRSKREVKKIENFNKNEISKEVAEIGVLPDGRKVVQHFSGEQYIYAVNGSNTVNRSVRVNYSGKHLKREVNAFID